MPSFIKTAVGLLVIALCGSLLISGVGADAQAGWISTAEPSLQKTVELPANQSPALQPDGKNRDCINQQYNYYSQSGSLVTGTDCLADSTLGKMGLSGSPLLFNGTSQAVTVTPNYPYLLQPIPNQGMMLSPRSAPVIGNYLYFYRDIRQAISANYSTAGHFLNGYTVNREPDFALRDKAGNLIVANDLNTLAYSSNGSWMMVDSPGVGFLRINLATFDVVPFAPSLNGTNDYSNHISVTAISDDGKYAAVASFEYGYFKVFDLTTCTGTTGDTYAPILTCQSRDYWPYVSSHVSGFKNVYTLRFANDDNLQVTTMYDWQSSASYKVAKYTLTAPGKQSHALDYLAIGDSYISGQGEFQYKAGTDEANNKCHLSPLAYPYVIGAGIFNQYESIACSGAKIKDITGLGLENYNSNSRGRQWPGKEAGSFDAEVYGNFKPGYRTQISFIKTYQPRAVTLSIGGNDIGFANIVKKCVVRYQAFKDCYQSYDDRMNLVKLVDGLYPKLQDTYSKILKADPGVQLYVIGYPQVTSQDFSKCGLNVQLSAKDLDFAHDLIVYLNSVIEQAANSKGVRYVDVQHALDGHRLCEASAASTAVNGATAGNDNGPLGTKIMGEESYHPNVLGHQLLAQAILRQTSNFHQTMPSAQEYPAPSATDQIAQAFLYGFPVSGTSFAQVIHTEDDIEGAMVARSGTTTFRVGGSGHILQTGATYQVSLVDDTGAAMSLGSTVPDANGDLPITITIPTATVLGAATVRITGQNIAGETIEIDEAVIVVASPGDHDGDGVLDAQQECGGVLKARGTDTDSDGIDDACDPVIGDAPVQGYPVTVHLTGNTIYATRQ